MLWRLADVITTGDNELDVSGYVSPYMPPEMAKVRPMANGFYLDFFTH